MYLWVVGALLVLGGLVYSYIGTHPNGILDGEHEGDVRTVVSGFGNQLNTVSLLSPTASSDIQTAYGSYVAPSLLAEWTADPSSAPGRTTSSPWPDHIEVTSVEKRDDGTYMARGSIVLLTSTGNAGTIPVQLTVAATEGGYRIIAYHEGPEEQPALVTPENATMTLALGEQGSVLGISLTPLEVLEDSRCPTDVVCIQAGTVRVAVEIESPMGTSTMPFTLNAPEPITTEAEAITLISVEPYPLASDPTKVEQYRFTFAITKR